MARPRSPVRDIAMKMWIESNKTMLLKDIASEVGVSEEQIRKWKNQDNWDKVTLPNSNSNVTNHRGAPLGNKNAVGNKSSLPGNKKAEKHGLFAKYLPPETLDIVNNMSLNPLDILWDNIQIAYAAIVRAQQINYVRDIDDMTTTQIKQGYSETGSTQEWEIQQAWDKQSNFMKSQARAQAELRNMIKQYDELLKSELATEEQKLRIEKLRYEVSQLSGSGEGNTGIKDFLKAVKPTQEDIKALFADEEVNDNAEEAEKE